MTTEMFETRSRGKFVAHAIAFAGDDDAYFDGAVIAEVTAIAEGGYAEISYTIGDESHHLSIRVTDLLRAIKEFKA